MFTTDSICDIHFFVFAFSIVEDVHENRRIEWKDDNAPGGSRIGTLRDFTQHHESHTMPTAIIRVTLDNGFDHEVLLVDLMNADRNGGYERL